MRPTSKSPFCPPLSSSQGLERRAPSSSVALQRGEHNVSLSWPSPWAAAGLSEPDWWKAFVVDKNLVVTRRLDHPGRKPQQEPKQQEAELNRRSPTSTHRPSASAQPSMSPMVERLLSPPAPPPPQDLVVHHHLAQIEAEFGGTPSATTQLDIAPEAGFPTAGASVKPASAVESLATSEAAVPASHHSEGMAPEGAFSRLQSAFWTAPVGLTFSWQLISSQPIPSPIEPTTSNVHFTSTTAEAVVEPIYGIEDAEYFELKVPFTEVEAAPVRTNLPQSSSLHPKLPSPLWRRGVQLRPLRPPRRGGGT
jgi:hypothetical protein